MKYPGLDADQKNSLKEKRTVKNRDEDDDFGVEGTNKTLPEPQPGAQPSAKLAGTKSKFIEKSPFTRRP